MSNVISISKIQSQPREEIFDSIRELDPDAIMVVMVKKVGEDDAHTYPYVSDIEVGLEQLMMVDALRSYVQDQVFGFDEYEG